MKAFFKKQNKKFFVITLCIIIVISFIFSTKKQPPKMITHQMHLGDLIQRVTIPGSVAPNKKTVLTAPFRGFIKKLFVDVGDHVHTGDPVISIVQSLKDRIPDEDLHPLRAPFSGKIVQILKTEGESVEAQSAQSDNAALIRIDDLSRLFAEALAPEVDVGKLRIGLTTTMKAPAVLDHTYHGIIRSIFLSAKEQKDWEKARIEFPVGIEIIDFDDKLMPGMSLLIDVITLVKKNVLIIPHDFLLHENDHYTVMMENGSSRNIVIGARNDEGAEVISGLKEHDRIIAPDPLGNEAP